jgi:AraC-like DNA-binding protein
VEAQLEAVQRYLPVSLGCALSVVRDEGVVRLILDAPPADGATATLAEAWFARLMFVLRNTTGQNLQAREVRLQGEAVGHEAELARVFGVPVQFRYPANELVLDDSTLQTRTTSSDPQLVRILTQVANEALARLPGSDPLRQLVRQAILKCLPDTDPSVNHVAARLAMSPRTLQRRLSKEGTSYQQVLDSARLERSIDYLARSHIPIAEAAALLGFSDLTSFHRAFKRWMGTPPAEFRRQCRAESRSISVRRAPIAAARSRMLHPRPGSQAD